jgi:hypothetical protein
LSRSINCLTPENKSQLRVHSCNVPMYYGVQLWHN